LIIVNRLKALMFYCLFALYFSPQTMFSPGTYLFSCFFSDTLYKRDGYKNCERGQFGWKSEVLVPFYVSKVTWGQLVPSFPQMHPMNFFFYIVILFKIVERSNNFPSGLTKPPKARGKSWTKLISALIWTQPYIGFECKPKIK
jgi:hypothetical protein